MLPLPWASKALQARCDFLQPTLGTPGLWAGPLGTVETAGALWLPSAQPALPSEPLGGREPVPTLVGAAPRGPGDLLLGRGALFWQGQPGSLFAGGQPGCRDQAPGRPCSTMLIAWFKELLIKPGGSGRFIVVVWVPAEGMAVSNGLETGCLAGSPIYGRVEQGLVELGAGRGRGRARLRLPPFHSQQPRDFPGKAGAALLGNPHPQR